MKKFIVRCGVRPKPGTEHMLPRPSERKNIFLPREIAEHLHAIGCPNAVLVPVLERTALITGTVGSKISIKKGDWAEVILGADCVSAGFATQWAAKPVERNAWIEGSAIYIDEYPF